MNGTFPAFELIELRSFSNVWYWIFLAAAWSAALHRPLGVPYDLVRRARAGGAGAEAELGELARIMSHRSLEHWRTAGPLGVGVVSAVFTVLGLLGFAYGIEVAQAGFLLLAPFAAPLLLGVGTARRILADGSGAGRHLRRHRALSRVWGTLVIFGTAGWGTYVNLTASVL